MVGEWSACWIAVGRWTRYPRAMPDRSTAAQTREMILEAAAHEIVDHGYAAASLSRIAGRLGLTKGALAYHFPTKGRILTALMERFQRVLVRADAAAVDAFADRPSRACVAFVLNVGHAAGTDIVTTAAMGLFTDPSTPPRVTADPMGDWVDRVRTYLQSMVDEEGYTFELDLSDAAEFIFAALGGTWMTARFFPRAVARPRLQFTQLALQAVGVPHSEAEAIIADVLAAARDDRVNVASVELMTGKHFRYPAERPEGES